MRNLIAGLLGTVIGAVLIVILLGPSQPSYPAPYDKVWFIFAGSNALQTTPYGLLKFSTSITFLITWIVIGIIIAPFSKKGWNTVRSAIWIGIFQGIVVLASLLLTNPEFWSASTRNLELVYIFATSLLVSLCSLISAYPMSILLVRARKQSEAPIPQMIETRCQCGAVFKSKPLICSECGTVLREVED